MAQDPKPVPTPLQAAVELPLDLQVGVFADFAAIWHTPSTFVLDFITVKTPPQAVADQDGNPTGEHVVPARVSARVRIPPEQIFGIINAMQEQARRWMEETGKSEPPEQWFPQQVNVDREGDEQT